MKDFKYYVIFGISLIAFVYVAVFMPSIPLKEEHADEQWYSDAENQTDFFENGIQDLDIVKQRYNGKIEFSTLNVDLNVSIGMLKSIYTNYSNTVNEYDKNKVKLFEEYGIDNYIEFDALYSSVESIISDNKDAKIKTVQVLNNSIIQSDNGIIFNVDVTYTNDKKQTLIVVFYNEEHMLEAINGPKTTFKILPKVEG